MSGRPARKIGPRSAILLAVLALAAVVLSVRRDKVFRPGETIRYDDFFFTLRGVNRSPLPTAGAAEPHSSAVEYLVKLTVENRAKRVPFRFTDESVALVDPNTGKRYWVHPEAQRAYEAATGQEQRAPLVLKPGESATGSYVFRLPAGVTDPRLRIAPGGWGGMAFENLLFGVKEFRLP
jgi:hypothetical protein